MPSKDIVEQFISSNRFFEGEKSVFFNALISFYQDQVLRKIPSRVEVIGLHNNLFVYIDEFADEQYQQREVYGTDYFHFNLSNNTLEIRQQGSHPDFLISIRPFE
jgi:hypothetical protein